MPEPPTRGPWHTWFAWRPVKTDWFGWRWLTTVERSKWYGYGLQGWSYRPHNEEGVL